MQGLIQSSGWKRLIEIAEGQKVNRYPEVLGKTESVLGILGKEFEKGEISGIMLFMALPEQYLKDLKDDIRDLEEELGHGRDDGDAGTDGDDGESRDFGNFEPPI